MADPRARRPEYSALARPALGIVLVMVLMMASAGLAAVRIFDSLEQLHDSASRASDEAAAADEVLDSLQDSETAIRGYLLTMRPAYLDPYLENRNRLEQGLARLEALSGDTPWLRDAAAQLRAKAGARMAELDRTLAAYRAKGGDAALAVILTDDGRRSMDAVRADYARIIQHAGADRENRTALLIARERETLYLIMGAALVGMLLLGSAALGLLVSRNRVIWAQSALSAQTGRLKATVDHIRDGIAVFDATDRLILWNRSFFPIAGLPPALAALGTPFASFAAAAAGWSPPLPASLGAEGAVLAAEVRVGDAMLEVWRGAMPDGGHILAVTDITRRNRAESIARQAQKMEALGQLTGGIAHDFNNLLQVISANLELLGARLSAADPPLQGSEAAWLRDRLGAARAGIERGARLVQHMLAFARRQPLAPQATDPARLLRDMEEMLRRTLGPSVQVELAIPQPVWAVRVDPQQLESAVLNLAINGRDAIAAATSGSDRAAALRIGLANVALTAAAAAARNVDPGDYVELCVTDTGTGMTEAVAARAVEPFFTTKADGYGTGLGLPMVYGFAQQSGGGMKIDSAPGQGTTVSLLIPRTASPPPGQAALRQALGGAEPSAATTPRRRVLLAEDDRPVRQTTAELLCGLGHDVQEAGTAAEALALLDRHTEILMTDLGLPDMDGADLVRQALRAHPDLAVIIASGKAQTPMPDNPRVVWLNKPYNARGLAAALSQAAGVVAPDRKT